MVWVKRGTFVQSQIFCCLGIPSWSRTSCRYCIYLQICLYVGIHSSSGHLPVHYWRNNLAQLSRFCSHCWKCGTAAGQTGKKMGANNNICTTLSNKIQETRNQGSWICIVEKIFSSKLVLRPRRICNWLLYRFLMKIYIGPHLLHSCQTQMIIWATFYLLLWIVTV